MGLSELVSDNLLILVAIAIVGVIAGVGYLFVSNNGEVIVTAQLNSIHIYPDRYHAIITVRAKSYFDKPLFLKGIYFVGSGDDCRTGVRTFNMKVLTTNTRWVQASVALGGLTDADLQIAMQRNQVVLEPNHELTMVIYLHAFCPKIHSTAIQLEFTDASGNKYYFTSNTVDIIG